MATDPSPGGDAGSGSRRRRVGAAPAIRTSGRTLALGVRGSAHGFPDLGGVARSMAAIDALHLVPGPSFRPPHPDALHRALPPVKYPAVRAIWTERADDGLPLGGSLGGRDRDGAQRTADGLLASARAASALGCARVVVALDAEAPGVGASAIELPPGVTPDSGANEEEEVLADRLCRRLHALLRRSDGVEWCLTPPSDAVSGWTPRVYRWALEDLGKGVAYWHDSGRVRALAASEGPPERSWLDALADRCVGVDLTDCVETMADLPPGSGEVDFPALREALEQRVVVCLSVPVRGSEMILSTALDHVRRAGLLQG